MKENDISKTIYTTLKNIYTNRHQGKQYYISYANRSVGNPKFTNENSYAEMPYPDSGFRLLTAYRLWNIVQYFSPNKHITNTDWNDVLKKYITPFVNANDELSYEIATLQLIGEMKDTHSNLWRGGDKLKASRGSKFPPVHLSFVEEQLVIVDFYNPDMQPDSGVQIGDIITHINGKKVSEIVTAQLPFYHASNKPSQLRDLARNILISDAETQTVSITNESGSKTIQLKLYDSDALDLYAWYRVPEGKYYKMLANNLGYVTLANITNVDPKEIVKEFTNAKGLILDIRNYPSAFMPFALGQFLAPRGTEFVKFTTMNLNKPGEFTYGKTLKIGAGNMAKEKFEGPVIVLVNELSQSQAEYTAMAFRAAPNTTVVGSTTAGADGNVSSIKLPGNMATMISGIGVYYPDGSPTQRVGIVPDVEVKPTIKGIRQGKDELIEKAIELIITNK